ncbi:MAG: tetratricopeptide repeat protein [Candidatus Aminicenantes bacterium]|nr:tetratricopeptide repeat protein [Candidatus Aminicenantes bacterium]
MYKTIRICLSIFIMLIGIIDEGFSCTVFTASTNRVVLFGNNEDTFSPFTRIWFLPAEKGKYGRIYFGIEQLGCIHPQGGVNDRGLAFDILAAPSKQAEGPLQKEQYIDTYSNLIVKVMEECATVSEAVGLFNRYYTGKSWSGQYFVADRNGDAAIIEIDTVHRKQGPFLVATNFYLSQFSEGEYPCRRFKTASAMLRNNSDISVEFFKEILSAVHLEGDTPTQYSNIIDLRNEVIYLYHFHDYKNVVVIDVNSELSKGRRSVEIASIFPEKSEFQKYQKKVKKPILRPLWAAFYKAGVSEAIRKYYSIKKDQESPYDSNEWLLKVFGWELADGGRSADAIEIFRLVTLEFPDSAEAYEKLGWAFYNNGQFDLAVKSYKKCLELNPENRTSALMLKRLNDT